MRTITRYLFPAELGVIGRVWALWFRVWALEYGPPFTQLHLHRRSSITPSSLRVRPLRRCSVIQILYLGPISGLDLQENGSACVSVGEDGRVNLISVGDSGLEYRRVFDSKGLVSYTAARWASPTEFATGDLGSSLQWWDQRRPGGPISQFKGNCVKTMI
ncbi:hypothetical protein LXL04_011186 [Taraxacum kok-saghyz]